MNVPVIFFDTETTGVDENQHSILEIALIAYDLENKKVLDTYQTYISHSSMVVTPEAMSINKIDLAEVFVIGISPEQACTEITAFIQKHGQGRLVMPVGHNVDFDVRFLKALYRKCAKKYPFAYRTMDTCSTARFLMGTKILPPGRCGLVNLVELFQVPVDESKLHGALYDTELTIKVFEQMASVVRVGAKSAAHTTVN